MIRFKEDAGDAEVKRQLWSATEREILRFANRFAEEHEQGNRYSRGQRVVCAAAKKKGYPKTMIQKIGRLIRREAEGSQDMINILKKYRWQIGLGVKGEAA